MKDFWNERFSQEEYVYGTEPNVFFAGQLQALEAKGRLLLPAEGEGRNAVYAAGQGWDVVAYDYAAAGRKKALQLAEWKKVRIDYRLSEAPELDLEPESFDAMGLIYAHFSPSVRSAYHRRLIDYLKPGGMVIMEAFSKEHLTYNQANPSVGGPQRLNVLFSEAEVRADFPGFRIERLETVEIELAEGAYHRGVGSVVRFVGVKEG